MGGTGEVEVTGRGRPVQGEQVSVEAQGAGGRYGPGGTCPEVGTGSRVDTSPRSGPWGGSSDSSLTLQVAPCWLGVPGFRSRTSGTRPLGNTGVA